MHFWGISTHGMALLAASVAGYQNEEWRVQGRLKTNNRPRGVNCSGCMVTTYGNRRRASCCAVDMRSVRGWRRDLFGSCFLKRSRVLGEDHGFLGVFIINNSQ